MIHRRRRLIRSGSFGGSSSTALQRNKSSKKDGLCTVKRSRVCAVSGQTKTSTLNLAYTIYRPNLLLHQSQHAKKPLLVIHGGPSIPSDYLQPMAQQAHFNDRCVIFYDQIGCGNSSIPKNIEDYSIQKTVDDLEHFIRHLKLEDFHLMGHSYGGIIAYEYSKRLCEHTRQTSQESPINTLLHIVPNLLSVTLCSAPSNVCKVEEETKLLMKTLRPRSISVDTETSADIDLSLFDATVNEGIEEEESTEDYNLFHKHFVCRTTDGQLPKPLQEAYKKKGDVWEGTDVIIDWVVTGTGTSTSPNMMTMSTPTMIPPILLLRGQYDFVSEKYSFDEWKKVLHHKAVSVSCQTLNGCSHYSMLENTELYSLSLNTFLVEHDK